MKSTEFKKKLNELTKSNIAIVGHMGSGKSIVGRMIADKLGLQHIDIDSEIVKFTNQSIAKIFENHGEKYFRKIEKNLLTYWLEKKNIIISLGGGSILEEKIRNKLKENSVTVFLDVKLDELEKRLKKSTNRPLLKNVDLRKKIKELDTIRRKYYLLSNIKIRNTQNITATIKNFIDKFANLNEKNYSNKD